MGKRSNIARFVPRSNKNRKTPNLPAHPPKTEGIFLEEALSDSDLPPDIPDIPERKQKEFAHFPKEVREKKFAEYAAAEFHSRTNNFELMLKDALPELEQQYANALKHYEKLCKQAENAEAVVVTHQRNAQGGHHDG